MDLSGPGIDVKLKRKKERRLDQTQARTENKFPILLICGNIREQKKIQ
jgi:hypothetical protein